MRILQVINSLEATDGGPSRNAFDLYTALGDLPGVEPSLHSVKRVQAGRSMVDDSLQQIGTRPGVTHGRTGLLRVFLEIPRTDLVIIHGYYLWWVPFAAVVSRLFGASTVALTPHGSLTEYQQRRSKKKKTVFDRTVGYAVRATVHTFATGSERESYELRRKFPRVDCRTVGVGTKLPGNLPDRTTHGQVLGLRLLTLSRIAPKKRFDLTLACVRRLIDNGYDCHLDIYGDGDASQVGALQKEVSRLKLETSVTLHGHVGGEEKVKALSTGGIFLLPSDDENFGIGVAEALAYGNCVVTSGHVESSRGIRPPAGIVVASPSEEALVNAVLELSAYSEADTHAAATRWAREHFNWARVATNWVNIARKA